MREKEIKIILVIMLTLFLAGTLNIVVHAQFPPTAVVGRYVLSEDNYWRAENKTVQELRDEGYDVQGDSDWLLLVNYTRLDYTFTGMIVGLSWPSITAQTIEGGYDLNVTAHRLIEDGSIGEKITSFVRVDQPPRMGNRWESQDPSLGPMFNPSVFIVGNTFSGNLLEYSVNRAEILTDTPWGQNETYVLRGYFANATHLYDWTIWCDSESGIILRQIVHSKAPTFISYEEHRIVETGIKYEVVHEEEIYEIPIETNSTITDFDPSAKKISLTIDGPTATLGTCKITIPKEIVPANHNIEVYFNGQKTDYELTKDTNNYYVYVEYQHSVHTLTISFMSPAIWMQLGFWAIVITGIAALMGAIYFIRKREVKF
jgi:hypothetical protein